MQQIRLGTIGSGAIVHLMLDAVKATDGIVCHAVYSRTKEKGQALADEYGAANIYTDIFRRHSCLTLRF